MFILNIIHVLLLFIEIQSNPLSVGNQGSNSPFPNSWPSGVPNLGF